MRHDISTCLLFVLTLFCALVSTSPTSSIDPNQTPQRRSNGQQSTSDGVPDATNFLTRAYHSTAVIGNYLYIDGGEIAYLANGQNINAPDNNTYSIDLSQPWTNSTLTFETIAKSAPVLNSFSLWTDKLNSVIYQFGGEQSSSLPKESSSPLPDKSLWRLNPDGKGSGRWLQVTTTGFESIVRPAGGISTSGAHGGVILGGYQSRRSSSSAQAALTNTDFIPQPGLIFFNYTSQSWFNRSAEPFSQSGTAHFGGAHIISGFGYYDIFAFFGGDSSDLIQWKDDGQNLIPFDTIHLYDPYLDRWYSQRTSGSIPTSRDRFCTVGIRGDNGTYEVIVYGGHVASNAGTDPETSSTQAQQETNIAMDEIFVLSIPGFVWVKADYPATSPRIGHSCEVIGNRQMIVVGGRNPAASNESDLIYTPDPWTNGIGLFDLGALRWREKYNPTALDYTTPDVIKGWYATNGKYPSQWDNDEMKNYFSIQRANDTEDAGGSNSTSTGSGSTPGQSSSGSSSNAGAIAGGVVGGLVGLALVGVLAWWLFRRRSQLPDSRVELPATKNSEANRKSSLPKKELEVSSPELEATPPVYPRTASVSKAEMMEPEPRPEAATDELPHEMPASPVMHELP